MDIYTDHDLSDSLDAWILGVCAEQLTTAVEIPEFHRACAQGFQAQWGTTLVLYPETPLRVVVVGLGEQAQLSAQRLRRAMTRAARLIRGPGIARVGVAVPGCSVPWDVVVEGLGRGLYQFQEYLQSTGSSAIESWTLVSNDAVNPSVGMAVSTATTWVRDWVNLAPRDKVPERLAARMIDSVTGLPVQTNCLTVGPLTEMGAGGLAAVGSGSAHPPVMLVMRYQGAPENPHVVALVGKGITFDSGGLSLKTKDAIKGMKTDMAGAAVVVGVVRALADLRAPLNVWAIACLAENMPSGTAQHPDDVIRLLDGTTVEVISTDAEGRLVLADGVSWARREGATAIIDVATLTGSSRSAFGGVRASYVANDEELARRLEEAAQESGELVWRMPDDDAYAEMLKSPIADLKNLGGSGGGMQAAALFLRHFARDTPWIHIDIAGTEMAHEPRDGELPGATGFGVSLLSRMLLGRVWSSSEHRP